MESISKMLNGTLTSTPEDSSEPTNDVAISSGSPEGQRYPDCPDPVPCEFCGAPRYTKGFPLLGKVYWTPSGPERCSCPEAIAAYEREKAERMAKETAAEKEKADAAMRERIRKNVGNSGMTERALRQTFEHFHITADNRSAHAACAGYAENFAQMLPRRGASSPGRNGLLIMGPCGTGKTHLAFAIANHLLSQGTPVIAMTAIELLGRIKRTYAKNAGGVDEDDILRTYAAVPLLVIDDLGKERASEWTASTIYSIIDRRYNAMLPTIITTNYSEAELIDRLTPAGTVDKLTAAATLDRISEICRAVVLVGQSWRRRGAAK